MAERPHRNPYDPPSSAIEVEGPERAKPQGVGEPAGCFLNLLALSIFIHIAMSDSGTCMQGDAGTYFAAILFSGVSLGVAVPILAMRPGAHLLQVLFVAGAALAQPYLFTKLWHTTVRGYSLCGPEYGANPGLWEYFFAPFFLLVTWGLSGWFFWHWVAYINKRLSLRNSRANRHD